MDVTYANVKVYVTGRNDVIKRHNVITIVKKIYVQKWKVCKKKNLS